MVTVLIHWRSRSPKAFRDPALCFTFPWDFRARTTRPYCSLPLLRVKMPPAGTDAHYTFVQWPQVSAGTWKWCHHPRKNNYGTEEISESGPSAAMGEWKAKKRLICLNQDSSTHIQLMALILLVLQAGSRMKGVILKVWSSLQLSPVTIAINLLWGFSRIRTVAQATFFGSPRKHVIYSSSKKKAWSLLKCFSM